VTLVFIIVIYILQSSQLATSVLINGLLTYLLNYSLVHCWMYQTLIVMLLLKCWLHCLY